jgi:hypothetical protein
MALKLAAAALVAVASCGCRTGVRIVPSHICQDGLPSRVLVNPACAEGICGWTCEPDRWTAKE